LQKAKATTLIEILDYDVCLATGLMEMKKKVWNGPKSVGLLTARMNAAMYDKCK